MIDQINRQVSESESSIDSISDIDYDISKFSDFVKSVDYVQNELIITFKSTTKNLNDKTVIYYISEAEDGKNYWNCRAGTLDNQYRTEMCKIL